MARGITVTEVAFLAFTSHANPTQCGHPTHAGRPWLGTELMAMGIGKGCHFKRAAARASIEPSTLSGNGGIGYGLLRGGSKEFAPALPETPISHSALV